MLHAPCVSLTIELVPEPFHRVDWTMAALGPGTQAPSRSKQNGAVSRYELCSWSLCALRQPLFPKRILRRFCTRAEWEGGRKEGGGGQVKSLVDTAIAFSNLVSQYRRFPNGTKVLVASRAPVEGSWIRRLSLTYFQGYLITKTKCFHARQAFGV